MSKRNLVLSSAVLAALATQTGATVLIEYDASGGLTPDALPNPWTRYGVPMFNIGGALLQDNTFDDPDTSSGEYLSPSAGAGTMQLTSGQYGIEVRVRPLTDVPFLSGSHYANAYVFWSDDQYAYNITIDKDTDDGGAGSTGGIKYGQNSMSDALTGIDWSVPHTIYVGYRSSAPFGTFDFYLDGVLTSSRSAGSMARSAGFPFAQNAVDFGDGTTGQGLDVAVEWYSVKIHDSAVPVVPPSVWNVNASGNWSTAGNWTAGVPDINTGAPTATFGSVITAPKTITVDANHAIGKIIFDNANSYTVAGPFTLQMTAPGNAQIEVLQGSHSITAPLSITSPLLTEVANGATLSLVGSTIGTWAGLAKEGAGTLLVSELHATTVSVNGGVVRVAQNGTSAGTSKVNSLGVAATAKLDISDNKLVTATSIGSWDGSNYTGITGLVQTGRNGGAWDGPGITTSMTDATSGSGYTMLGVATGSEVKGISASQTDSWGGVTVTGSDTLVMYTYGGDANLSGGVDIDDYGQIDSNASLGGVLTGWFNGDFDYSGTVDIDDYGIIDSIIGIQGAPFSTGSDVAGLSAVPEPGSIMSCGLLAAFTTSLRLRRR